MAEKAKHILDHGVPEDLKVIKHLADGSTKKVYSSNYPEIVIATFENVTLNSREYKEDLFYNQLELARKSNGILPSMVPFQDIGSREVFIAMQNCGQTYKGYLNNEGFLGFENITYKHFANLIADLIETENRGRIPSLLSQENVIFEPISGFKVIDLAFRKYESIKEFIVDLFAELEVIKHPRTSTIATYVLFKIDRNFVVNEFCNRQITTLSLEEKMYLQDWFRDII